MKKISLLLSFLSVGFSFENDVAYIPSQCYTKTEKNFNPCFSCHKNSKEPNYVNDGDLQAEYSFPTIALKNHWTNLFKDRTEEVSQISDKFIENYVKTSNYIKDGKLILSEKLKSQNWKGYIPDCYFNFKNGLDINPNNYKYTGWVAFEYYPFLGTFWATNGSTDDVIIRLPKKFRTLNGKFDKKTYFVNLAIVESMIKGKNIKIDKIDEKKYGIDLNKNGKLDIATEIVYKWKPLKKEFMSYVGDAKGEKIAFGLFPLGTEFLHTVRYIDFDKYGNVTLSNRIKEVRYAKKYRWLTYSDLKHKNREEIREQESDPDEIEEFVIYYEKGAYNSKGWIYQGFIEDKNGDLRPQTREETLFCIGCHSGLGATTDGVFAFPRKIDFTKNRGWRYWKNSNYLKGIKEPKITKGGEYSFYLKMNRAGDEFRDNFEVMNKFFDKNGNLKQEAFNKLSKDISYLVYPSKKRAFKLNKAYKVIVNEQSYIDGRSAHIKPIKNVYKEVKEGQSTGLKEIKY